MGFKMFLEGVHYAHNTVLHLQTDKQYVADSI